MNCSHAVRQLVAGMLTSVLTVSCAAPSSPYLVLPLAATVARAPDDQFVEWLGVSSWIISRGPDVVVVDPFFSRPSLLRVGVAMLPFVAFEPNEKRIDAVLPKLPDNTVLVLVGHGHYDHLMDLTHYAKGL